MGNYRESGEVLFMKNGMKKTAAVVMAAMLMGDVSEIIGEGFRLSDEYF